MRLLMTASVVSLAAVAGSAHGAIEEFSGYSGSLFGQNGGSTSGSVAWTGAWGDVGFGTSMGINAVSIGAVNTETSASPVADFTLTAGGNGFDSRRGFTPLTNANDIYVWGLVCVTRASGTIQTSGSYGGIGLFGGGTERMLIGEQFNGVNWGIFGVNTTTLTGAGTGVQSGVPMQSGVTVLLVARIDQVGNTFSLWVNPNLANAAPAPDAVINIPGADSIDTIALRAGNPGNGNGWQFDNIHVERGSPFGVPTPGAAVLLGLGGLVAGRRRRA